MKEILLAAVALSVIACAGQVSPRDRYVTALNHRLDGNATAHFDEMIALAHEAPDSRAGRRARASLQSSGLGIAVVGILAAIAVPNFMKFQAQAKQSEAKTNLRALFAAQKAYRAEHGRYCKTFKQCGWSPAPRSRYLYILGQHALGGDHADNDKALLRMRAADALDELGIEPRAARNRFLLVAVGNLDNDNEVDVWTLDQDNDLRNVVNDRN